jgi:hypothetical protein
MKNLFLFVLLLTFSVKVSGQQPIEGKIAFAVGKPWYPLHQKVLAQVSESVYFETQALFGIRVCKASLALMESKGIAKTEFIIDSTLIQVDTLPFELRKAGYMSPSGWVSDFFGSSPKPAFSLNGVPNTGWPKFLKDKNLKKELLLGHTDYTIIIWPILAYYSTSAGSPPFSGPNGTVSLLIYGVYHSKSGKLLHIDYVKAENLWASKNIDEAYPELVQRISEKFVQTISKELF